MSNFELTMNELVLSLTCPGPWINVVIIIFYRYIVVLYLIGMSEIVLNELSLLYVERHQATQTMLANASLNFIYMLNLGCVGLIVFCLLLFVQFTSLQKLVIHPRLFGL